MLEVTDYVAKSTRFIARRRHGNRGRRLSGDLGVTSIYLQGIDSGEIIETVRSPRPQVIPAAAA